jgi:hypothetical protein
MSNIDRIAAASYENGARKRNPCRLSAVSQQFVKLADIADQTAHLMVSLRLFTAMVHDLSVSQKG